MRITCWGEIMSNKAIWQLPSKSMSLRIHLRRQATESEFGKCKLGQARSNCLDEHASYRWQTLLGEVDLVPLASFDASLTRHHLRVDAFFSSAEVQHGSLSNASNDREFWMCSKPSSLVRFPLSRFFARIRVPRWGQPSSTFQKNSSS